MKQLKITLLFLMAILLFGCAEEDGVPEPSGKFAVESPAVEKALQSAEELFAQLPQATRGTRQVESIKVVSTEKTRSMGQDSLIFVINYADNGGFAVVSNHPENPEVLAISDQGRFENPDNISNPFIEDFLKHALAYAYQAQVSADSNPNTRSGGVVVGPSFGYNVIKSISPLVGNPTISNLTYTLNGTFKAPKYSTMIPAILKLLYGVDVKYDGVHTRIDWSGFESITPSSTALQNLMSGLNSFYTPYIGKTNEFWAAMHFSGSYPGVEKFYSSSILFALEATGDGIRSYKAQPVLVKGEPYSVSDAIQYHYPFLEWAFVIDGAIVRKPNVSFGGTSSTNTQTFYHCLWGEDYNTNGYYRILSAEEGISINGYSDANLNTELDLQVNFKELVIWSPVTSDIIAG